MADEKPITTTDKVEGNLPDKETVPVSAGSREEPTIVE